MYASFTVPLVNMIQLAAISAASQPACRRGVAAVTSPVQAHKIHGE